jgi:hypothetical protein
VAFVLTAALLAGCTGGSQLASGPTSGASGAPSGAASTTAPAPTKSTKPARPTRRPPKPTGPFRFRLAHAGSTLTASHQKKAKIRRATSRTAADIHKRFDSLFRMTYVDPAHWKDERYGEAFQTFFGGQVRPIASHSLRKLTLGPDAGNQFESVGQPTGRLNVKVLIGPGGGPVTALVRATFNERAHRTNGGTTVVVSDGRYYLQPSSRGWVISAFSVGRHDHNQ